MPAGEGEGAAFIVTGEGVVGEVHDVDLDVAGADGDPKLAPGDDGGDLLGDQAVDQVGLGPGDGVGVAVGRVMDPRRMNTAMPPTSTQGWSIGKRLSALTARASTLSRAASIRIGGWSGKQRTADRWSKSMPSRGRGRVSVVP